MPRSHKRLLLVVLSACCLLLLVYHHQAIETMLIDNVVVTKVWPLSASTLRVSGESKSAAIDINERVKIFEKRRKHYIDACAKTPQATYFRPSRFNKPSLLRARNLAYCSVAKTGSTLWKQIIFYVQTSQNGSFFGAKFKDIHSRLEGKKRRAGTLTGEEVKTVVFVREPYSRLFSAYVGKIFRSKVTNWRHYGAPILKYNLQLAKDENNPRASCASDVTFAEYVRFFIDAETGVAPWLYRNPHYLPVSQHCGFCTGNEDLDRQTHAEFERLRGGGECAKQGNHPNCSHAGGWRSGFVYDFIAKTEDISRDTDAIFQLLNLSQALPADFNIAAEGRRSTVMSLSRRIFHEDIPTQQRQKCMSKEEALRRLWKNFQIRSLISKHELFPLSPTDVESVTADEFVPLVLAAFDRSQEDPDVKKNRRLAMTEAYSTVSLKDRKTLRRIFEKDFAIFDYPDTIPEVFPENDVFQLDSYRFFDVMDRNLKV